MSTPWKLCSASGHGVFFSWSLRRCGANFWLEHLRQINQKLLRYKLRPLSRLLLFVSDFAGLSILPKGGDAKGNSSVTSPPKAIGVVFTRWGSRVCPKHTTKLYDGMMAGPGSAQYGGGTSFLCMHPEPQFNDMSEIPKKNRLFGVEYANTLVGQKNLEQDAACAVCQHNTALSTYVQWGRMSCSNGHTTHYSGYIMASIFTEYSSENICVDFERAVHSTSTKLKGGSSKLYTTEFHATDDSKHAKDTTTTQTYPRHRELACAVCSPPKPPAPPTCQDFPGWTDAYGDGCSTPYYSDG